MPAHSIARYRHLSACSAQLGWQAIFMHATSARAKTYEYRVFRGEICPPWQARYVYALNAPLNVEAMQRAAVRVCGEHDFTSFAATRPRPAGARCRRRHRELRATICAASTLRSGFKHRRTTCLFIACGAMGSSITWCETWLEPFSRWDAEIVADREIPAILESRARERAGPTAPARGLFLVNVEYSSGN